MSSSYWFPVFGGDAGKVLIQEVFDRDEAQIQIGKKGHRRSFKVIPLIFWTLISTLTFITFQHWSSRHPQRCSHSQNADLGGWVMRMWRSHWAERALCSKGLLKPSVVPCGNHRMVAAPAGRRISNGLGWFGLGIGISDGLGWGW